MNDIKTPVLETLETLLQYLLCNRLTAHLLHFLAFCENEKVKNMLIKNFGKHYKINTKEAVSRNLKRYPHFNSFYTRKLKADARSITDLENGIACPVDGIVTQAGIIKEGDIIQAKGKNYSVSSLLGADNQNINSFEKGIFTTLYLSPKDYHRVHMPFNGTLSETVHIPGRLFNIVPSLIERRPSLYAKNERVISFFDTELGPMALVMVGSIFSSSIETVWDGVITPPFSSEIRHWNYPYNPPKVNKGDEVGHFNLGSTVILLFANNKISWEKDLIIGKTVKMGELIGRLSD